MPQPLVEVFKLQRGEPEETEENDFPHTRNKRKILTNSRRRAPSWGWARTGLEPEVSVYVYQQPFDAILDLGSNVSLIDEEICDDLCLGITPFNCDLPHCVGIQGAKMTKSVLNIIGWVEIELGVPGLGCLVARLWVVKSLVDRGMPIVLGSHQVKRTLAQVNAARIDCWPQPWKHIYERCISSEWYRDECSEVMTDSDSDSFELVPNDHPLLKSPTSMDAMLEQLELPAPSWEEQVKRVEEKISTIESTALKGIQGPSIKACMTPSAKVLLPPPRIMEELQQSQEGDELSVFTNLVVPEGFAEEATSPTCNHKELAPSVTHTVRLPSFPIVSCRVTPTGNATLYLQWEQ